MEDFKSKYTGEQVESFLDKIEDNSIILDNTVEYANYNEPLPISSDAVRKLWDRKGYIYDAIILVGGNHEVSGNTKLYGVPKTPIVVWKSESFELKVGEVKVISNGPPIRATLNYIEETGKYILNIEDPNGALATNRLYYINNVEPIADILIPNNVVRKSEINLPFYIDEVNLQTLILEYNENEGNPSPISSSLYENIVKAVSEKKLIFIKRDTVKEGGYILLNIRKDDFLYYSILTEDGNIIYGEISNEYIHIYNIIHIETIQNMMEDFNTDIAALYQTKQENIDDIDDIRSNASLGASIADKAIVKNTTGELLTANAQALDDNSMIYATPTSANGEEDDILLTRSTVKTINGQSIVGSGNIVISGGGSSSGGSGAYAEVNHGTNDTTFALTPNAFHVWDEVSSLTLTLGTETSGVANEYIFQFTSGSTATTLSLPDGIKWTSGETPTIESNKIYQVSILKGLGSVLEWDNAAVIKDNFISISGNILTFEYPTASELTIDVQGRTTGMPSSYILTISSGVSFYTASNLTNIIYINSVTPSSDDKYNYTYDSM